MPKFTQNTWPDVRLWIWMILMSDPLILTQVVAFVIEKPHAFSTDSADLLTARQRSAKFMGDGVLGRWSICLLESVITQ